MSDLFAGSSRADAATLPPAVLGLLCSCLLNTQSSTPSRQTRTGAASPGCEASLEEGTPLGSSFLTQRDVDAVVGQR